MEFDLHSYTKGVQCGPPAAYRGDEGGAAIDTVGFESLEYVINVGTALVGGGFTASLEESDTGAFAGEETAVDAGEILGALPTLVATGADTAFRVGSMGKKRYQRIVLNETGTVTAGVIGVVAVLSNPKHTPVPDQST
jgi:hypothetical protein